MPRHLIFIISGVIALSSTLSSIQNAYAGTKDARYFVTNPAEFNTYVRLHKERTRLLALHLFSAHPQDYDQLSLELVNSFMRLHDLSKSIPEVAQRLYKQYSRPLSTVSEREKTKFISWVNYLNERDRQIGVNFFTRHELNESQVQKLLELEKIADLVDRSFDPVAQEDFGKLMVPASEFIKDPQMAAKAKFLERQYHQITKGHSYLELNQLKAHSCKLIL